MQPLTAVTLVVSGFSLVFISERKWWPAKLLASIVGLTAIAVMVQHWFGLIPQIDSFLFKTDSVRREISSYPVRPAEISAISFVLIALFVWWPRGTPRSYRWASRLATLGLIIAVAALAGYFLNARELSDMGGYISMGAPTFLGFFFLFTGALVLQKDENWIHLLTSKHVTRNITLSLMAFIIAWPLALGLLISTTSYQTIDPQLKYGFYALFLSLGMGFATIRFIKQLAHTEKQRNRAIAESDSVRLRLSGIFNSAKEAIIGLEDNQSINFVNPAAERLFGWSSAEIIGKPIWLLVEKQDYSRGESNVSHLLNPHPTNSENSNALGMGRGRHKDGSLFPIDISYSKAEHEGHKIQTLLIRDLTFKNRLEHLLRESEHRLSLALEAGGTGVWDMDVLTSVITPGNDMVSKMLGYDFHELQSLDDWIAVYQEEDREAMQMALNSVIEGKQEKYRIELRARAKDGKSRWLLCQAIAAERDAQGRALRLVGTHTDITERKEAEEKIRDASLHDHLTGLPNRSFIFEYGSHLLASCTRTQQHCALLFIDLDRFKPINDIYGHEFGDKVLQEISRRLISVCRAEDMVGRLGGDEFVVLLPHLDTQRQRSELVAKNIIEATTRPIEIDDMSFTVSASIGVSYFPDDSQDINGLVHTADLAMYLAKHTGRSNYQFYRADLESRAEEIYALEGRMKVALRDGGFILHYQPVIDLKTGKLISAEALVRLSDKNGNPISPYHFISIAEASGIIGDLGAWVTREACRQQEAWHKEGLDVVIAINVSPVQFRQKGFTGMLREIIAASGVDPHNLQLEVTESSVMENVEEAVVILNEIKMMGLKVSLDDFGTGYSSLSRLSTLPLDKLKVDQSFVCRLESDSSSRAVTDTIISLGRSLGLEVIGEGIESEQTFKYLKNLGCDQAQGFFFSKPLNAQEFSTWCRANQGCCIDWNEDNPSDSNVFTFEREPTGPPH